MPKRTLIAFLLTGITTYSVAQTGTLPTPTDLKAVLAPTMGPLPVVALTWKAPEGERGYRIFRSDGDSLNFRLVGSVRTKSYFDQITTGPNTYFYQVRSYTVGADSSIVESPPSNTAWITIPLPPPEVRGFVTGVVKDDTTGEPIAGIFVKFFRMTPSSNRYFTIPFAFTDSLGQYTAALDTGVYTIRAEQAPYMPPGPPPYISEWFDDVLEQSAATLVSVGEGQTSEANFGLSRKQFPVRPKGIIAGTVSDDGTQLPIPRAIVRFFYQGPHIMIYPPPTVYADSLGQYRAVLDTGTYLVRAEGPPLRSWYPMYQPEWYDNVLEMSEATPVSVTPESEFVADFGLARFTPPKLVTIEGTVTNDVGNTDQVTVPLAGATVVIMRPIQVMDAIDVLWSSGIEPGIDAIDVDGLGYCRGVLWRGKTDSTGHYKATVLAGYNYIAVASKRGYLPEYYKEKVNPLQADIIKPEDNLTGIDFTLALKPGLQNSISGVVRDSLGNGVPSRIVLFPVRPAFWSFSAVRFGHSDSTGAYRIGEVREGSYFVLAVPFHGYAPAFYKKDAYGVRCWVEADTVNISGDVTGIDVGVVPFVKRGIHTLAGRVVSDGGNPIDAVRVYVLSAAGEMLAFGVTDNAGYFAVDGLPTQPLTVTYDREGYEQRQKVVTPVEGESMVNSGDIRLSSISTAVSPSPATPSSYRLYANYPNPFNPSTTITFDMSSAGVARLVIYNILGQEITTLYQRAVPAGQVRVVWNGRDRQGNTVPTGIYLVRFTAQDAAGQQQYSQIRKMVLLQ